MTSTMFELAEQLLAKHTISYTTMRTPVVHLQGNSFVDANCRAFKFSRIGAGYVHELVKSIAYSSFTRWFDLQEYMNIAEAINSYKSGTIFHVAELDGNIVGIMKHYEPLFHTAILKMVKDYKLENLLVAPALTQTDFSFTLRVESESRDPLRHRPEVVVGLRIINGHSGHVAFHVKPHVKCDVFEWHGAKLNARRRHFSVNSLNSIHEHIEDNLAAVRELAIISKLVDISAWQARHIIQMNFVEKQMTRNQQQLMGLLDKDSELATGLDVVTGISRYSGDRGMMAAVNGLLNPLFDNLLEKA